MKTAIYCRTSTRDQHPENQKVELEKYAKGMGYDYEIFVEQESTRKTRPIKNKIFQDAIRKKYDLIITWKLDRWARSLQELINDFDILKSNNVQFYSYKEGIKLDNNPANNLMISIIGALAQFERDVIRERTLAGLDRTKANGTRLGRPKGSKDKGRRRTSGYLLRWQKEKVEV